MATLVIAADAAAAVASSSNNEDRNKTVTGYPIQSSTVTGYPTNVTNPQPQPQQDRPTRITATFYEVYAPNPPKPPGNPLIFRLIYALCTFILLSISCFLLIYLLLRPNCPQFQITSASLSTLNATNLTSPFATWRLTIMFKNPNEKYGIFYDRLQVAVGHNNYVLSQIELPPLVQLKMNETLIVTELGLAEGNLGKGAEKQILLWKSQGEVVEFEVRVMAMVRFRTGHWWFRNQLMVVYCPGLYLGFSPASPNGTLMNPNNNQCEVDM